MAETEFLSRTKPILSVHPNKLQFGFTERCLAANCAFIILESIAEEKGGGNPLLITKLNARKAFDVVWHSPGLISMYIHSVTRVTRPFWNIYADMYTDVASKVYINNELTQTIIEKHTSRWADLNSDLQGKNPGGGGYVLYTGVCGFSSLKGILFTKLSPLMVCFCP